MKRNLLASSALAITALAAGAANAVPGAINGTVLVEGTVNSVCTVATGGAAGGQVFSATFGSGGTILNDSVGHLNTGWGGNPFNTKTSGQDIEVLCNNTNPTITLNATPMVTGGAAPQGFANTISYHAELDVATRTTGNVTGTFTENATTGFGAGTTDGPHALGGTTFIDPVADNIIVKADTFTTPNTSTDLLVPGGYQGNITITITPG